MYVCICYKHVFLFKVSPETEMKIAVQALMLNTHRQQAISFTDTRCFSRCSLSRCRTSRLEQALRYVCKEANLVVIDSQVRHYSICMN